MSVFAALLHKMLLPFVAGLCLAGAASAEGFYVMTALIVGGAMSIFASLPIGGRVIRQIAGGN